MQLSPTSKLGYLSFKHPLHRVFVISHCSQRWVSCMRHGMFTPFSEHIIRLPNWLFSTQSLFIIRGNIHHSSCPWKLTSRRIAVFYCTFLFIQSTSSCTLLHQSVHCFHKQPIIISRINRYNLICQSLIAPEVNSLFSSFMS